MIKRFLWIGATLSLATFVAIAGITALVSSRYVANIANIFLPTGWEITTAQGGISPHLQNASLPQFTLSYQKCPLVRGENLTLKWQPALNLHATDLTVDYRCFAQFQNEESSKATFSLNAFLLAFPVSEISAEKLHWVNLPTTWHSRVQQLFSTPSKAILRYFDNKLHANVAQQAVEIDADFTNNTLTGNVRYQPSENEKHNLVFTANLREDIISYPLSFDGDYQWDLPKTLVENSALRAGSALLKWQADEKGDLVGNVQFTSENQPKNKLNLPFKFDFNSLEIYQGKFNWEWLADFPINGSTTATITPKNIMQGEIFPIQTAFRMNLFSEDKHTLSLATTKGVIEESAFDLPLTLSGYVKYHGFRLFSQATIAANQREMRFSPKSMFHIISGKERFLTINELTIPLGDIYINRYGVNGRLQAHFKGETPDFKEINMRLDGRADNFKMGLLHFFDDANGKNSIKDRWQWTLNGETKIHAIQGNVAFSGKGNWHKNLIQFTQFNGKMNQVKLKGVTIPKTELALTEPVKFAYEQWHLTGGAELRSPELQFDYGGKLLEPRTQVRFAGELEKLRFDGDIQAGKAGPIKLTASRQLQEGASSSEFVGSLKWAEQPTSVFQALIPPRTNWVIKDGTIKGDTKFHTHATQGLVASGQISIKNGELSLPKGNISGIEFVLPYQLVGNQVKFGQDKPISVMIDEVNAGVAMRDIRVNIDGYYPYNANKPLNLRRLNLTLLDGTLSVEHFALPQLKPAYLELKNIVLERVMELVNYQQIELKGKANAKLPFWLDGSPCYICEGEITQSGHSNLKISKELMDAMAKTSGYSERILLYLLNDTKVTDLQGRVNVAKSGDMTLNAQLKLQLNQQEKTKVNFNYNHKENVFDLWHLINSASYIGQGIENGILQKLDSTK